MPLVSIIGRESEEGGGRTKYVLTAVGLSIIVPVLDRCLVGWWVGCYDDGAFLTLVEVETIIYDTGEEFILAGWITTTTRFVCRLKERR